MWCAKCHADVAAEVTPDNARARCASCGAELGLAAAVRAADKTREARELLQRWSDNRVLDPFGPVAVARPATAADAPHVPGVRSTAQTSPAAPESPPPPEMARPSAEADAPAPESRRPRPSGRSRRRQVRVDAAHAAPAPHADRRRPDQEPGHPIDQPERARFALAEAFFDEPRRARAVDVQSAVGAGWPRRTNWLQLAGHTLAYSGALVLTMGMALVLVGYFGGPQKVHFTPTGWLVATFGQLLLVSGVITLVSSGMERTAQEVSVRIDALGEKLLRFERAAEDSFPPRPALHKRGDRPLPAVAVDSVRHNR